MKFELIGKAVFHAEGIDDAFLKLSEHFKALAEERETSLFEPNTSLHIRPIAEATKT